MQGKADEAWQGTRAALLDILGENYRFPGGRAFRKHGEEPERCGQPERRRVLPVHPPVPARLPRRRAHGEWVIHTAGAALKRERRSLEE